MHGIVFDQLREFTVSGYGVEAWEAMLAQVPDRSRYYVSEDYPDAELEALLGAASSLTGSSRNDLLRDFGRFIVPGLLELYGVLIDPKWDILELLENIEGTIHRVVRLRQPGATPPQLGTGRTDTEEVSIFYDSPRMMCALGKGIIEGLQTHYGERLNITDQSCMHRGDPICTLVVRRRSGSF